MHLSMSGEAKRVIDQLTRRRFGHARGYRAQTIRNAVLLLKYLSDRQAAGDEISVRDRRTGESERLIMAAKRDDI